MAQLEAGTYYGALVEAGLNQAKTGTALMELVFEVRHVAANGEWVAIDPIKRTVRCHLSDSAWPYSEKKLATLGFNGDFANPAFSEKAKTGVQLICEHETFEGKVREKWSLADWGGGAQERTAPDANVILQLGAKWRASQGQPVGSGTPASAVPAGAPAEAPAPRSRMTSEGTEGIPF